MHTKPVELFNSRALSSDSNLILITEGEIDAVSIWQAFEEKISVIAILGVANWKATLLPKLDNISNKKFLILFDAEEDSRKQAENLRGELIKHGFPATCRFFYDALLNRLADNPNDTFQFDVKVDANQILQEKHEDFLRILTQELIDSARADFIKNPDSIDDRLKLTDKQRTFLFSGDLSDLDNARRIEYMYGKYIRFVTNRNQWLTFKNGLWTFSEEGNSAIAPATTELADKLFANASSHDDINIAQRLKSSKAVDSAVKSLRGLNSIRITSNDLNRHNNLLNCLNGVIDLQTGKFYEIVDPALLITQQCNAVYRPNYHNEVVEKFLHDILPDEETLVALIRFLGYAATGECSEEKALLFNGGGGNGKGTLTRTLIILFGSYATTLKTSAVLLTGKTQDAGAATTDLNPLENCRVATIEELPQGGKLDAAKFKNLTGSNFIPIRRLHQEQIKIEPHFSPILSGNYLTELSDTRDSGLLRRLMNIYFTQSFIGKERDPHLKEKLASLDALSGFLSLIVEAAKLWYRDGLLL